MRKILESGITVAGAFISLAIFIKWYLTTHEIEPLTGIVAAIGVLLIALVYRLFPEEKGAVYEVPSSEQDFSKKIKVKVKKIKAGGSVQIGDRTINTESVTSRRLRLFLHFFVPLLAIGAAVLWYCLQEMQRPPNLKVRIENLTPNPELPEPTGTLSLTYGTKTDPKTGVTAETLFEGIPANFKNENVRLLFEAKGFVTVDTVFPLENDVIVLPVRRNGDLASITGFLANEAGKPLEGVKVSMPCCSVLTDAAGKFVLNIPIKQQRESQRLDFFKKGFAPKSVTTPVIPGEALRLVLKKN